MLLLLVACVGVAPPERHVLTLRNVSEPGALAGQDHALAPGLVVVHHPDRVVFDVGDMVSGTPLEPLVEDGDNAPIVAALSGDPDVYTVVSLAALDLDYHEAPMGPGGSAVVTLDTPADARISLLVMLGQSNDVFVATPPGGVDVFPGPVALGVFDAGTEVDQEPGVGPDQAARQAEAGQGEEAGAAVALVQPTDLGGFAWPAAHEVALATLEPAP